MATPATGSLANAIITHLTSKSLLPTQAWLDSFLSTQRANTPQHALRQTALFRLLASDITKSLQSSPDSVFPADITDGRVKERKLAGPIPVQVLDVEDIGRSRWSQVEAIEAFERGETTKGREIIRVVPGEEGLSDPEAGSSGPHKLLLQDAKGTRVYAFEMKGMAGVNLSMSIGTKMALKNVTVARGVLLLDSSCATLLGGKMEELHKAWKDGRKEQLKSGIPDVSGG